MSVWEVQQRHGKLSDYSGVKLVQHLARYNYDVRCWTQKWRKSDFAEFQQYKPIGILKIVEEF